MRTITALRSTDLARADRVYVKLTISTRLCQTKHFYQFVYR